MNSWIVRLAWSSIGKKVLMAITGAGLCGFLVTHLAGNLLIFVGPEAFNGYAHGLITNPLLIPAELVLLAVFLLHIALAAKLTLDNSDARPVKYAYEGTGLGSGKGGRDAFNWTIVLTGIWILVFVVLHLLTFKFTQHALDVKGRKDFHALVTATFQKPLYVAWYVASMVVLGFHLRHGVQSMFRSIGAYTTKYVPALDLLALAFSGLIAGGYMAIPLWLHFMGGR
jgi:succinate dehydrogenase / fumarate reductase cytochrome b subunit